ncbi:MmgE/PrpD family protein [Mesorhizobium sp. M1312]|uniref:MmgE/PrpD family protein n=1 Tax=unclassified Mesorhizobium TaxID=325217 RepID=UPI00333D1DCF
MSFVAETLAQYIRAFTISDMFPSTRYKISDLAIDLVGAAAAGFPSDPARATRAVAGDIFQAGQSSVWFTDRRLTSCAAGFANSAAASAMDVDDGHREAIGHPGAPIISAVLAEGESLSSGEERLACAIAIGYEIGIRIAAAQANRIDRHEYATGRWASIAVAASVGFLRGLDEVALAQSLAIAGTHRACQIPSGASRQLGQVKEGIAWSTLNGFLAVSLAEQGVTASLDIFDIPALFDVQAITAGLGTGLKVDAAYTKPYSCCRWIHAAIDALLILMDANQVAAEDVEAVIVHTIGPAARLNNKTSPSSHFEAQFSVPYCLAVAALEGAGSLLAPDMGDMNDRRRIVFAQKVRVKIDPVLDGLFPGRTAARVELVTRHQTIEQQVDFPKGDAMNPMKRIEIVEKFRTLARYGLDRETAERVCSSVASDGNVTLSAILKIAASSSSTEVVAR